MQASTHEPTLLEAALRRDRYIVLVGLAAITLLAWGYLVYLSTGMSKMDSLGEWNAMAMPGVGIGFGPVDMVLIFLMWAVMMVGMMVPSAAPMILAFANINRRRREQGNPYVPTAVFVSGYLLVWVGFSVSAALAQVALVFAIFGSSNMGVSLIGGALLLAAGAFQLSPLKSVCLRHCRTPMGFITNDWRDGRRGALLMGLHHGSYCLGCCWALMGLLFLLGVMNLLWIAALAVFVLVEKVVPAGVWWAARRASACWPGGPGCWPLHCSNWRFQSSMNRMDSVPCAPSSHILYILCIHVSVGGNGNDNPRRHSRPG